MGFRLEDAGRRDYGWKKKKVKEKKKKVNIPRRRNSPAGWFVFQQNKNRLANFPMTGQSEQMNRGKGGKSRLIPRGGRKNKQKKNKERTRKHRKQARKKKSTQRKKKRS